MADGDRHLLVDDQVFELDLRGLVDDLRAALVAVLLLDLFQLLDDDVAQLRLRTKNRFVLGNLVLDRFQFLDDFVDGKTRQAVQLQFEDRVRLLVRERLLRIELRSAAGGVDVDLLPGEVGDQVLAGIRAIGTATNDRDHVVEVIERDPVAFQNVLAVFRLLQQERRTPAHHVNAVIDEVLDRLHQAHLLRLVVDDGQEDHAEARLHVRVLVELVEHDLRFRAALQFDHDAHAVAIGFVAHVADVVDDLVVHQFGDALDQRRLVHLVRNFGDDDGLASTG